MNDLIKRSLSGLLYVSLIVLALNSYYLLNTILIITSIICQLEFNKLKDSKPKIWILLIYSLVFIILIFNPYQILNSELISIIINSILFTTVFINLILIRSLFMDQQPMNNKYILSFFYIGVPFIFLSFLSDENQPLNSNLLLGVFIIVWTNDTFAYLTGRTFGKNKLFPSISPKKTIEGFVGGGLFSLIISIIFHSISNTLNIWSWLVIAFIIFTTGTLGDLVESKFKRIANVKDSGAVMPGHGGLLDRFDSIIFSIPFVYLFLRFFEYVS